MTLMQRFKRDLAKHRAKAVVLGILFLAMLGFSVKAVIELGGGGPNMASAAAVMPQSKVAVSSLGGLGEPVAAQGDMRERQTLSAKLREVKATAAEVSSAFAFDASFYPQPPPDPNRHVAAPAPAVVEQAKPAAPQPAVESEAAKAERIRAQAVGLVVKSTTVGNGTLQPLAIVNQQLLTVGQEIAGFEIVAIRAREVLFRREGVQVSVKMLDEPRGQ